MLTAATTAREAATSSTASSIQRNKSAAAGVAAAVTALRGPIPIQDHHRHFLCQEEENEMSAQEVQTMFTSPEDGKAEERESSAKVGDVDRTEKHWEHTLETLQNQIMVALSSVEKDRVDVTVGKTSIQRDRAVILAWTRNQNLTSPPECLSLDPDGDEDGLLLYLAIRYKKGGSGGVGSRGADGTLTDSSATANSDKVGRRSESEQTAEEVAKPTGHENDENNNSGGRLSSPPPSQGGEEDRSSPLPPPPSDLNGDEAQVNSNGVANDQHGEGVGSDTPDLEKPSDPVKAWTTEDLNPTVSNGDLGALPPDQKADSQGGKDNSPQQQPQQQQQQFLNVRDELSNSELDISLTSDDDQAAIGSGAAAAARLKRDETPSAQKKKKSVRWKERLEESSPAAHRRQESSAQSRSRKSRRDHHMEAINRGARAKLLRTSSLDEGLARNEKHNRPKSILKRTRSNSTEYDGPVIVLTSRLPKDTEADNSVTTTTGRNIPQVRNMIRRIRSRHVPSPSNLWFSGGSDHKSFNSRCSDRFDINDLDEDSRHYFYFRSLPKVSPPGTIPPNSGAAAVNCSPSSHIMSSPSGNVHVQGKANHHQK